MVAFSNVVVFLLIYVVLLLWRLIAVEAAIRVAVVVFWFSALWRELVFYVDHPYRLIPLAWRTRRGMLFSCVVHIFVIFQCRRDCYIINTRRPRCTLQILR